MEEGLVRSAVNQGEYGVLLRVLLPGKFFTRGRVVLVGPPNLVTFDGVAVQSPGQLLALIGAATKDGKEVQVTLNPDSVLNGASTQAEFRSVA